MKKGLSALLFLVLFLFASGHRLAFVQAKINPDVLSADPAEPLEVASFRDQGYTRTLSRWLQTATYAPAVATTVPLSLLANPHLTPFVDPAPAVGVSALLEEGDAATFIVDVAFASLIEIAIDFYLPQVFYTVPSVRLEIDGELLYSEMAALKLPVEWSVSPLTEAERYNRYGNELLPQSVAVQQWTTGWFEDPTQQDIGNYQFYVAAGSHTITIKANDLSIAIGSLTISGKAETPNYQSYLQANAGKNDEASGELIVVEGQDFVRKNDLEVKSSYYKESAMTPYSYRNSVLNQLDGASMTRGGTAVTYRIHRRQRRLVSTCAESP
ncbi:MAG: hypothetical protein MZU97_20045 [Bacillus subtilis]|nr:hypothetical protein [Bacillus subtilis]